MRFPREWRLELSVGQAPNRAFRLGRIEAHSAAPADAIQVGHLGGVGAHSGRNGLRTIDVEVGVSTALGVRICLGVLS